MGLYGGAAAIGASKQIGPDTTGPRDGGLSVLGAMSNAVELGRQISQNNAILEGMVERAEGLAFKLGGPYPPEGADQATGGTKSSREPGSTVDALNTIIGELFDRSNESTRPLARLERALSAIDRAIG
ncbi:hypothetical protein [Methylobacterium brachythecii]|uniref:Uncharacterized protein n=1 Tax=Methylobacterium brachythecii TaxID=1176177 RepID=A0A7W6AKF6_9HYPH|nr:hypothetical protein [Methylobacterium brachythecii]MBB3905093.1 hypothetical protein [Methylobacterium brachythecii]GLS44399.1 hypothetical protein GCM10007884_23870 [Methylobacterium brachythecii]